MMRKQLFFLCRGEPPFGPMPDHGPTAPGPVFGSFLCVENSKWPRPQEPSLKGKDSHKDPRIGIYLPIHFTIKVNQIKANKPDQYGIVFL